MDRTPLIPVLPLALYGLVLAWWAWKSGGYFEVTFLPGTMLLLVLGALIFFAGPPLARLGGPALVSFVALAGLAAWTLISGIWSPIPAVAFSDAQRALAYVAVFGIGIWSCLLLGRRMLLVLAPLAAAGALVGLATLIVIWTGHNSVDYLETDATLRYPLGYRNAEAAFFLMALLPTIVLATSRELDGRLRGVLLGSATLMIELAVLAQSRASVFAVRNSVSRSSSPRIRTGSEFSVGWACPAIGSDRAALALGRLPDAMRAIPLPRSHRSTMPALRSR